MHSDIIQAKAQEQDFLIWINERKSVIPLEEFKVTALSLANWPYSQKIATQIPLELTQCINVYEEYWKEKQVYKKLNWSYIPGTLTLLYNYSNSTEIVCSTIQGLALLLFNNSDILSFSEICLKLGLNQLQGKRVLCSLMWPHILLEKNDTPDKWKESSKFRLNLMFKAQTQTIRLEQPEEEEKHITKVEIDRGIIIEAAIAKIMKVKKKLSYNELIQELIKLPLKFVLDPKMIDKGIEKLIANEYIVCDTENPKLFKYVDS